jgi:organic radical activating enzyme
MKKYKINEIFYSIQGEGFHTGTPAVFIRFAGCNLKCDFCDTDHTEVKKELSAADILAEIQMYPSPIVILTGGEPTLQIDEHLIKALKMQGRMVHVETNGTIALNSELRWSIDWVTLSPKTKEVKQTTCNELKIVFDGDIQKIGEYEIDIFAKYKYLQPMSQSNTNEVIKFIKANPQWKLSAQVHKLSNIQ